MKPENRTETVHLRFLHTSDVHGHVLDALPRVAALVAAAREELPDGVIVTDGGDVLQGHPAAYYYNFVDSSAPYIVSEAMNRVGYDVATIGNHDIETGRSVFERWIRECGFPVLGANILDEKTGEPVLTPYIIKVRACVRVAILGLITPAIPNWVPRQCWQGLRFEEMVTAAKKWIPIIQEREQPDLIVGLFHSGLEAEQGIQTADYAENEVRMVASQVSGFDLILYGHDHRRHTERVLSPDGDNILCIGPTSTGAFVCQVDVEVQRDRQGRVVNRRVTGQHIDMSDVQPVEPWFPEAKTAVQKYMEEEVGVIDMTLHERDAFFGSSAFIDLIHDLQFELSPAAEISFAAPLSFDAVIERGMTHVSDMYALYKYENLLYTMRLTGREVLNFLEMSYDLWTNTMHGADDHILLLDNVLDGGKRLGLKNMAFNFEAAAGIRYTVDASKPDGQKVRILSMEDGRPFEMDRAYLVATNSYRGNGGGELMTRGAGIPLEELPSRVVSSTELDLRYYFIEIIRRKGRVTPHMRHNWRFIPDEWAPAALARDRKLLFKS